MVYDVLIAVVNDADNPHRVQEGDIVALRPAGQPWGKKERAGFLVVPVELTDAEAKILMSPLYDGGAFEPEVEAVEKIGLEPPKTIHKRRYKLPLALLRARVPDLDIKRVQDRDDDYQPFIDGHIQVKLTTQEKKALFYDKHRRSFKYKNGAVEVE